MNYRLLVLTHGDCETLEQTLRSFAANVTPAPHDTLIFYDGRGIPAHAVETAAVLGPCTFMSSGRQVGFCEATGRAWQAVVSEQPFPDYVFWLEHDFEFVEPVALGRLAHLLDRDEQLAQVSLMRNAVNLEEQEAGGLYDLRRRDYNIAEDDWDSVYLEHQIYFTTNPALMTRKFMAENPWMAHVPQCEGRYGMDLVARGYRFAVWGDGAPGVNHFGVRNGRGY